MGSPLGSCSVTVAVRAASRGWSYGSRDPGHSVKSTSWSLCKWTGRRPSQQPRVEVGKQKAVCVCAGHCVCWSLLALCVRGRGGSTLQTEMKVNMSTYSEIRNWAKSKVGNRGPGERLSWGKRVKGQRKAPTCVASLRAQVAAARAEKCECTRPHKRSRLHQQLVAALLHLQLGRRDRWPPGLLGKGTGGPGLGGGVRMSRPPTYTSLEGRGRRAHPCLLSHLPFVTASHSSSPRPQPTRHPSPAGTFRRARSWHRAPHLPAAGHLVSSAWNVTLLNVHMHLQTQPCAHTCAHRSTCTHTHTSCAYVPVCTQATH